MSDPYHLIERVATLEEYRALCTAVGWEDAINFSAARDGLPLHCTASWWPMRER